MTGIGLLNEKPLHAALKEWYRRPGDQLEVVVDGSVIDIVRDDLLLEIQTRSFGSIKRKLNKLTQSHRVRLIYPIALEKWIVKLPTGSSNETTRRKSPRRGRAEDLFWEMVSFPHLLASPNFSVEVVMIREDEVRKFDSKRGWRRRGWVTEERRLLEVVEQRLYETPADWHAFLPAEFETFTAGNLAEEIGVRSHLAQKMVYCMRKAAAIELVGKQGRANLYRTVSA
jgi:hypothetical protein